eukprot:jgi/Psemu1/3758/gm1.3758_g
MMGHTNQTDLKGILIPEDAKLLEETWLSPSFAVVDNQFGNQQTGTSTSSAQENLEAAKSLGGTLLCKATIWYELKNNPLSAAHHDHKAYKGIRKELKKTPINHAGVNPAVEQQAIGALVIEGSDGDTSNLKKVFADNYVMQQHNYPTTSTEALDIVVASKDRKTSSPAMSHTKSSNNGNSGNQRSGRQIQLTTGWHTRVKCLRTVRV